MSLLTSVLSQTSSTIYTSEQLPKNVVMHIRARTVGTSCPHTGLTRHPWEIKVQSVTTDTSYSFDELHTHHNFVLYLQFPPPTETEIPKPPRT